MERLQATLKDLRRKHRITQMQCRSLVEERADILSQLQKQQKEFISLRQRFGMAQKENEDLSKSRVSNCFNITFFFFFNVYIIHKYIFFLI